MFGFKKNNAEIVKVVYVPTPKQDLGTRIKKMDFDPASILVGAVIPTTIVGGFLGVKAINKRRIERLMFKAVRNEVSVPESFAEYSVDVRNYVMDHPLTEGLSTNNKIAMVDRLLVTLDAYYSKHGVDNSCGCGCCECDDEDSDDSNDEIADDNEVPTASAETPKSPDAETSAASNASAAE